VGTFASAHPVPPPPDDLKGLRSSLERWVGRARASGLDDEGIAALVAEAVRPLAVSRVARTTPSRFVLPKRLLPVRLAERRLGVGSRGSIR
jgi:hypothetical protein